MMRPGRLKTAKRSWIWVQDWAYHHLFGGGVAVSPDFRHLLIPVAEVATSTVTAAPPATDTQTQDTPEPEVTLLPSTTITLEITPEIVTVLPTETPTQDWTPTPIPYIVGGADQIAFVKDNDIWISNLDASGLTRLTTTGGSKSGLSWTPDGQSVTYLAGLCIQMVDINTKIVSTVMCLNWANYLSAFSISPNGSQVAISLSDGLFVLPYDLAALHQIDRQDELKSADSCITYNEYTTKTVQWSRDNKSLAAVI
jgi:dipeptidyl aminopeptidase/acylaminoacyl peptidase